MWGQCSPRMQDVGPRVVPRAVGSGRRTQTSWAPIGTGAAPAAQKPLACGWWLAWLQQSNRRLCASCTALQALLIAAPHGAALHVGTRPLGRSAAWALGLRCTSPHHVHDPRKTR